MRDKRLMYSSEKAYIQRYVEAEDRLTMRNDLEPFTSQVKFWWRGKNQAAQAVYRNGDKREDIQSELDNLASGFPLDKGLQNLLTAKTLGTCTAEMTPNYDILTKAIAITGHGEYRWQAFIDGFCETISKNGSYKDSWTEFLVKPLDLLVYLETTRSDSQSQEMLVEAELALTSPGRAADIWSAYSGSLNVSSLSVLIFSLLTKIAPELVPKTLEMIPSHIVRNALCERLRVHEDPHLLMDWLARCNLVFRDQRWTGNSVVFIFLDAGLTYARRLMECSQQIDSGTVHSGLGLASFDADARKFLAAMCEKLIERADGILVSIELGAELVRRLTPRAADERTKIIYEQILDCVVIGILKNKFSVLDMQNYWKICDEIGRYYAGQASHIGKRDIRFSAFPYLLLASRMCTTEEIDIPQTYVQSTWTWYLEALQRPDPETETHTSPFGGAEQWVYQVLGGVLCKLEKPNEALDKAWRQLFFQRQQSRFVYVGAELLAPSLCLIRAGIFSLLWNNQQCDILIDRWSDLLKKCSYLVLGYKKNHHIRKMEVGMLFSCVNHVFRGDLAKALDVAKPQLTGDDWLILICAASLLDNGFSASNVINAMDKIGCDPLRAANALSSFTDLVGFDEQKDVLSVNDLIAKLRGGSPESLVGSSTGEPMEQ